MALYRYDPPRRAVEDRHGNKVADVRGMSFNDLNNLANNHFDNLDKLLSVWEHYQEVSANQDAGSFMTDESFAAFIADICTSAPGIMADIIAMATDEEDQRAAINSILAWPMHLQCRALGHIYALSVDDFGGPVKLVGALIQQIRQVAPKADLAPTSLQ